MAPQMLFHGDGWTITQDPIFSRNPNLVRFHRQSRMRTLLDQIAEWDPDAQVWVSSRWVPRSPMVPLALINKVVAHMRGVLRCPVPTSTTLSWATASGPTSAAGVNGTMHAPSGNHQHHHHLKLSFSTTANTFLRPHDETTR